MNKTSNPEDNDGSPPSKTNDGQSEVRLSVPWGGHQNINASRFRHDTSGHAAREFVETRTRVHERFIVEQEKTKRIGLFLSFFLILAAATIMVFAPVGRETLSYWIGAALIVFAGGAAGYKRIWGKSPLGSIRADQDTKDGDNEA